MVKQEASEKDKDAGKKTRDYFAPLAGKHDQSDSESDEDVIQDVEYDPDFGTIIGVDEKEAENQKLQP